MGLILVLLVLHQVIAASHHHAGWHGRRPAGTAASSTQRKHGGFVVAAPSAGMTDGRHGEGMLHQGGVILHHAKWFGQTGTVGGIELVEIYDTDEAPRLLFGRTTARCAVGCRLRRLLFRHYFLCMRVLCGVRFCFECLCARYALIGSDYQMQDACNALLRFLISRFRGYEATGVE